MAMTTQTSQQSTDYALGKHNFRRIQDVNAEGAQEAGTEIIVRKLNEWCCLVNVILCPQPIPHPRLIPGLCEIPDIVPQR